MINHGIEEVRQRLEDELGFGLPEETWKYVADLHVEEVLLGGWTIRDLAGTVRDLLKAFGRPMLPIHHAPRVLTRLRKRSEGMTRPRREEVISGLLADEAENEEGVATFRSDVLGGSLLSRHQVDGWIKRQAEEDGPASLWLTVPVPKGTKVKSSTRAATTEPPLTISEKTPAILIQRQYLSYISLLVVDEDPMREVPTAEEGVLEQLRQLSEALARHYGWDAALATNFVLTGEAPLVPSVEIRGSYPSNFRTLARISLIVDPALSPREVADHYRRFRGDIVGGRHRELSEKHMRLATFASARPTSETLRKRMAAWNKEYPRWKYKTESNFGRDCNQATKRLLHPDYGPKIKIEV